MKTFSKIEKLHQAWQNSTQAQHPCFEREKKIMTDLSMDPCCKEWWAGFSHTLCQTRLKLHQANHVFFTFPNSLQSWFQLRLHHWLNVHMWWPLAVLGMKDSEQHDLHWECLQHIGSCLHRGAQSHGTGLPEQISRIPKAPLAARAWKGPALKCRAQKWWNKKSKPVRHYPSYLCHGW